MIERFGKQVKRISLVLDRSLQTGLGSWIDGENTLFDSGSDLVVGNPSTGKKVFHFRDGGSAAAEAAIAAARSAHRKGEWRNMTPADRGRILWRVGQAIREVSEELAQLESLMVGRPLKDTRNDVAAISAMFEYYGGWCDKIYGEVIAVPTNHLNYTLREPYGVVAQLTPWNAPIFTGGWQLAPALCAGNCVVLKPSEFAPLTSLALVHLAEREGLPTGTVNVVLGSGSGAGASLVSSTNIDKVVFIGSVSTGASVAEAAGRNLVPCLLELGGKSPNIIFSGVDRQKAARYAINGVMQAAGQSCTALGRVLVHKSEVEVYCDLLKNHAEALRVGPATDSQTELGPLCHHGHLQRVVQTVKSGATDEVNVITGGHRLTELGEGYFFAPTVLLDREGQSPLAREEIFGPIVVVSAFENEEDAVEKANDSEYGLAAAVWASDVAQAHRVASRLEAGSIWINGRKSLHVMSPFGGYKKSGYGRSSGMDALAEYTRSKSIWVDLDT